MATTIRCNRGLASHAPHFFKPVTQPYWRSKKKKALLTLRHCAQAMSIRTPSNWVTCVRWTARTATHTLTLTCPLCSASSSCVTTDSHRRSSVLVRLHSRHCGFILFFIILFLFFFIYFCYLMMKFVLLHRCTVYRF